MAVHDTAKEAAQRFLKALWHNAHGRERRVLWERFGDGLSADTVPDDATCYSVGLILFGQCSNQAFVDFGICALRGFGSLYGHLPGAGNLYQISRELNTDQIWGKNALAALAAIDDMIDPSNVEASQALAFGDDQNNENLTAETEAVINSAAAGSYNAPQWESLNGWNP